MAWDILLVLTSVAGNLCNKCPSGYSNKTAVKVILSMRSLVSIEQQSPRRPCDSNDYSDWGYEVAMIFFVELCCIVTSLQDITLTNSRWFSLPIMYQSHFSVKTLCSFLCQLYVQHNCNKLRILNKIYIGSKLKISKTRKVGCCNRSSLLNDAQWVSLLPCYDSINLHPPDIDKTLYIIMSCSLTLIYQHCLYLPWQLGDADQINVPKIPLVDQCMSIFIRWSLLSLVYFVRFAIAESYRIIFLLCIQLPVHSRVHLLWKEMLKQSN